MSQKKQLPEFIFEVAKVGKQSPFTLVGIICLSVALSLISASIYLLSLWLFVNALEFIC